MANQPLLHIFIRLDKTPECDGQTDLLWILQRSAQFTRSVISLSVLMYALPSLNLQHKQVDELTVCWNSVIRIIFSFKRTTYIKEVLQGGSK